MNTARKTNDDQHRRELLEHLYAAISEGDLDQRLGDLLTPSEFSEVSKRLQIFKLLDAGIPQRQIAEQLGVGIATVTRGSRARRQHTED